MARASSPAQPRLLTESKALLALYTAQKASLYPTLGAEATKLYAALVASDETRDTQAATIGGAILDLADDRAGIAHAQHRFKAQLELTFEKSEKVYSFFDFSAAEYSRKTQKKAAKKAASAVAPVSSGPAS